jgi:hypothetical protein
VLGVRQDDEGIVVTLDGSPVERIDRELGAAVDAGIATNGDPAACALDDFAVTVP